MVGGRDAVVRRSVRLLHALADGGCGRMTPRGAAGAVVLVLSVALVMIAAAGTAHAHAAFVSSDPEPGSERSSAPGVVSIRFSEPLIVGLSTASVTDPAGRSFEDADVGDREIRVPLASNAPGVYTVEWKTVSPLDGHTLRGSFLFGVGVSPPGAGAGTGFAPRSGDLLLSGGRAVEYLGLLVAAGMLLLGRLASREPQLAWVRTRLPVAAAVALAGGAAVVLGEAFAAGSVARYLTSGLPGISRLVRVGAEAATVGLALRAPRHAAETLVVAFVALAAGGHAAAVRPVEWGIAVDAVHLISAGVWAGGILALAVQRPPEGWRGGEGRKLLARFTPIALGAFAITIATGSLRAFQELAHLTDLWRSSYGQILSLKILAVAAMIPLSVRAWRRITRGMRAEALLAVAAVLAAAVLAAYPLPPGRAEETEEVDEAPVAGSAIPEAGDVTLGGDAGETLVGLTFRPGRPGANEAFVFLLPARGPEQAEGVPVEIEVSGQTVEAEPCGTTCRVASVSVDGGEELRLRVGGSAGGVAEFTVPPLPAPSGGDVYLRANDRMQRLETYRIAETLAPPRPPIETDYTFQVPDRMHLRASTGFETYVIGQTQYRRTSPDDAWQVSEGGPTLDVPLFTWKGFISLTVKDIGEEILDGTPTRIITFFSGDERTPLWFQLWVGGEGLVHRMEMRAQAHFMDHMFFDFDAPLEIRPPT